MELKQKKKKDEAIRIERKEQGENIRKKSAVGKNCSKDKVSAIKNI